MFSGMYSAAVSMRYYNSAKTPERRKLQVMHSEKQRSLVSTVKSLLVYNVPTKARVIIRHLVKFAANIDCQELSWERVCCFRLSISTSDLRCLIIS